MRVPWILCRASAMHHPAMPTNRRIVVAQTGGPEVLQIVDEPIPAPGPGQSRVETLAADVSFSDVNMRRGKYPGAPRVPFTPGYAMVGIVDERGPGADGPEVGQTVAALTFHGSYSQYLCLPASSLVEVPAGLDPAEAVCLVLNYVAAFQMLHRIAHVAQGQRILVHGAAGGVGTAFLELGRDAGLEIYGTATLAKHDLVSRLGATPIDYQSEDFESSVDRMTGGTGLDAAFDPIGGAHLMRTVRTVRRRGAVVGYGFSAAANRGGNVLLDIASQYVRLMLAALPPQRKRTAFYDIRSLAKKRPDWFREDLVALYGLLAAGRLHPVIAERLPLVDAARAHSLVESAAVQGKVVLLPNTR